MWTPLKLDSHLPFEARRRNALSITFAFFACHNSLDKSNLCVASFEKVNKKVNIIRNGLTLNETRFSAFGRELVDPEVENDENDA